MMILKRFEYNTTHQYFVKESHDNHIVMSTPVASVYCSSADGWTRSTNRFNNSRYSPTLPSAKLMTRTLGGPVSYNVKSRWVKKQKQKTKKIEAISLQWCGILNNTFLVTATLKLYASYKMSFTPVSICGWLLCSPHVIVLIMSSLVISNKTVIKDYNMNAQIINNSS